MALFKSPTLPRRITLKPILWNARKVRVPSIGGWPMKYRRLTGMYGMWYDITGMNHFKARIFCCLRGPPRLNVNKSSIRQLRLLFSLAMFFACQTDKTFVRHDITFKDAERGHYHFSIELRPRFAWFIKLRELIYGPGQHSSWIFIWYN